MNEKIELAIYAAVIVAVGFLGGMSIMKAIT